MLIIKLDATDSTNTYLKNLIRQHSPADFTSVVAHHQLKGKGQRGASWESEAGKNLTFSTLKNFKGLSVTDAFLLNMGVSLAVADVLEQFDIPDVHVKWPNDILSGTHKICGVLIENLLVGHRIATAVFGIGLNVNQTVFHTISNATSMKLLLGETINLERVHTAIMQALKKYMVQIEAKDSPTLRRRYGQSLFRKDQASTFTDAQGATFTGIIRGVSDAGKLCVQLADETMTEFDLKQIKLLY